VPQLLLGGVLEARQQDRTLLKDFLSGLAAILEKKKKRRILRRLGDRQQSLTIMSFRAHSGREGREGNSRATSPRTIWGIGKQVGETLPRMTDLGAHPTSLVGQMRFSRRSKSGSEMSWTFRDSLQQNERAKPNQHQQLGFAGGHSCMSLVFKMLAVEQTCFLMTRHLDLIVEGNRHSLSFVLKPYTLSRRTGVFQASPRPAHSLTCPPLRLFSCANSAYY
jgi:hypothetical protein